MRSAANELGRRDPNRAAESGQRAADHLKRLERQMASGASQSDGTGRSNGAAADSQAQRLTQQLEQTRAIRERVQRAEEELRDAEKRLGSDRGQSGVKPGSEQGQSGVKSGSGRGQTPDGRGNGSGKTGDGELQRLREAYQRELQKAQDVLGRLGAGEYGQGDSGATPEQHEFSRSAPGTQAFKQDRSDWDSLRKNVDHALEKYEAAVSSRLSRQRLADRLSAGGSDRVPDAYRQLIARYVESVAKKKP
jgi:hypothetical protein